MPLNTIEQHQDTPAHRAGVFVFVGHSLTEIPLNYMAKIKLVLILDQKHQQPPPD
jgi:hypothetical protein